MCDVPCGQMKSSTPIKGAWIDNGYVIVTPAKGTDPQALKEAIEAAHGITKKGAP